MVGKKATLQRVMIRAATGTTAAVLCLQTLPALAQGTDEAAAAPVVAAPAERARGLTFGFEQRLEAGRNLGLAIPAEGTSTVATTRLSLGYFDTTAISRFSFEMDGVLRLAHTPSGSESGFADPGARLSYTRAGANAALSLEASAEQSDLTFDRDIGDFIAEDGTIDLPDDFDIAATGVLNTYSIAARLDLQRRAPLSFSLGANYEVQDYTDVTTATLSDGTTLGFDASATLRFSEISSATVALGYDDIQTDDLTQTHRRVTTLTLGYTREISPIARIGATLGLTHTDRELLGPVSSSEDSTTAEVELGYDLPNGTIETSLGVTLPDGGGTELIGRLRWSQALPNGSFSASLTQEADTTTDGETRPTTALSVSYAQDINALSGIEFGLTHIIASGTATRNRIAQTQVAVTYNRDLTEDWALSTGLSYQTRDEDTVGRSSSPFAFLSIGRTFDLR